MLTKEVSGKEETREVVETNSGALERLIAIAGRPLSGAQQHDEAERILRLAHKRSEKARRKLAETAVIEAGDILQFTHFSASDKLATVYCGKARAPWPN